LRETGWPAEIQKGSADRDLRQSDRFRDTVLDAEVERIQSRVRRKDDVNAVETKPRFIDERTEGMRFIEREVLPARLARVAKSRD